MAEQIVHREIIDRAPTLKDRSNLVGFKNFAEKLRKNNWVGEDGDTPLRNFEVEYRGHAEKGNNYIEWAAASTS